MVANIIGALKTMEGGRAEVSIYTNSTLPPTLKIGGPNIELVYSTNSTHVMLVSQTHPNVLKLNPQMHRRLKKLDSK